QQTHSVNVGIVESQTDIFPDTDALINLSPHLPIWILSADCVHILIYAPDVKGVAAVHAGWKGTLGGIIENTLDTLEKYGASPSEIIVAFGPSISKEKYEVSQELADLFIEKGFSEYVTYPNGKANKPHLDLQGINAERLLRRGVKKENIRLSADCTYSTVDCNGKYIYQSYRRDGVASGRNLTVITLLKSDS
ncbi:MAG: peptidoglycan editing factor PgeF, partial [Muribaculaceae bacterium]|nr:peptidoglycan editing factor PgeF [Muribaculaceae bacterium]